MTDKFDFGTLKTKNSVANFCSLWFAIPYYLSVLFPLSHSARRFVYLMLGVYTWRICGATASNAALTLRHYMQKRIKSLQSLLL
jgi:hypothetical protein